MVKKKVTKKAIKKTDAVCSSSSCNTSSCGGCGYFLGFIGAAVYYISSAVTFWGGVVGVLKSLVWPAFLVYEALKFLVA